MTNSPIEIEHIRLAHKFYQKVYYAAIPFNLVVCSILYGYIENTVLLTWLVLLTIGDVSQILHARRFRMSDPSHVGEYRRWHKQAVAGTFIVSAINGYGLILATNLPLTAFLLLTFFIMSSISVFSSIGFNKLFLAYATPLLTCFGIAIYLYLDQYKYLSALAILGFIVCSLTSRYYENTLLETIKIRFEKNDLLSELQIKKEEAEQANRSKSRFLASASHDLRQPLHTLGLYLNTLNALASTNEQREVSEKMGVSIDALNNLFDSLLDISKLDSGITQAIVEDFKTEELATRIQENFKPLAAAKGLKFEVTTDNSIARADPILLERIINNLVSNAIRYTATGKVSLSVVSSNDADSNEGIVVQVSDSGIGIPSHQLDNIFDEFYQLDNPERDQTKGLGLGLFIVRRLCDLMQLNLQVESTEGIGTKFKLRLPAGKPEQVISSSTDSSSVFDFTGLTVLVIDDDQTIRDAMTRVLNRWGCTVNAAEGLEDASLCVSQGFIPQLVIADYRLRKSINGVDVINTLKEKFTLSAPAILITGDTAPERLFEASQSGYQLLHKPVNPGLLRKTIAIVVTTS